MVLVLQTELSDGQMHPAVLVGVQPVPLRQQVEGCHREGQPCLEVAPGPMRHTLDVTYCVQHGEHRLDHHAHVPLPSLAYQQVSGVASFEGEKVVSQHDHLLLVIANHRLEDRVMHVSSSTLPIYNQPPLVEQQT